MAVAYHQLAIIISITGAYGVARLRGSSGWRPLGAAVLVAAAWALYTVASVYTSKLRILELGTNVATLVVLASFTRLRIERNRLRNALQLGGFSEAEIGELLATRSRDSRAQLISDEEHWEELKAAISDARECLYVYSGWLADWVIRDIRGDLDRAVARGVRIYLGYGWERASGPEPADAAEQAALRILHEMPLLRIKRFRNHAKILVCDDRYVICGSNNWLLNRRFRNRELSIKFFDRGLVEQLLDRCRADFSNGSANRPASEPSF